MIGAFPLKLFLTKNIKFMKKYFFMAVAILVVSAAAIVGIKSYHYYSMPELMKANLEALSQDENNKLYFRQDKDCVYEFTGKSNSTISAMIGGVTYTIKLNRDGYYKYVYKYGRTCCTSGGHELCEDRYCPPMVVLN